MLIPLGILDYPVSAAVASDYDLLETEILTGSQASVTFSSLGSYATDYQHLQIRATARTDRASTNDIISMTLNSDTVSSYASHFLGGDGSSVVSEAFTSSRYAFFDIETTTNAANDFSAIVADILDFSDSNKNTTTRALYGTGGRARVALGSSAFFNTAAITDIELSPIGNFVTGSRFSLYGLKAA